MKDRSMENNELGAIKYGGGDKMLIPRIFLWLVVVVQRLANSLAGSELSSRGEGNAARMPAPPTFFHLLHHVSRGQPTTRVAPDALCGITEFLFALCPRGEKEKGTLLRRGSMLGRADCDSWLRLRPMSGRRR